jgi:hypothetical protein
MRCPKCGYVSFDYNLECPKCRTDTSVEQSKLHLPSFEPSPPFLLGALVGKEDHLGESYHNGSGSVGMDGSTRTMSDVAEDVDGDGDIILQEAFDYDAREEIDTAADFSSPPSLSRRWRNEIKELLSELMPEKEGMQAADKIDGTVAEIELGFSGADRQLVSRDGTSGGDLVEGFGGLGIDEEDLKEFGGWRALQRRKRQTVDSEGITREVDRKKLEADEE